MSNMKFIQVALTALIFAFSMQVVAADVEYKNLNDDELSEFTDAIGKGNMEVIKKFVGQNIDLNDGSEMFAWPPLLMASGKNQTEAAIYFAEHGADLDYVHPATKWSAFMHAAYFGNEKLAKYLAKKGANVNLQTKGGMSIIRVVKEEGNQKMVDLLLSLGVKDDGCQTKECF
jgi:ankyrin repeat protein